MRIPQFQTDPRTTLCLATCATCVPNYPTTNGGAQNGELSWNTYTFFTNANLYGQSVIVNKISASELSWKFTKGALLVG